jgi:hypothetical protein
LLEYQERFLEQGESKAESETRKRQFKWKNVESTWIDNVRASESDGERSQDETFEYKPLQLKQLTSLKDANESVDGKAHEDNDIAQESESQANTSAANGSFFNKHIRTIRRELVNGPSGDIQSYIIKDKNLVKAMSLKRPSDSSAKDKAKRVRTDKGAGKSIFDVFQL